MEIIEYFSSDQKDHWLARLGKCRWSAGKLLYSLLKNGTSEQFLGEHPRVLMLTDGDRLVSFCTLAQKDDIPDYRLTPWIGFVYTFPEYRGRRCFGLLLDKAKSLAAEAGFEAVYISTDHIGLYEKYGFEYICTLKNRWADDCRVYKGSTR